MKISEYTTIDVKTVETIILVPDEYDENGNITIPEHEESVLLETPVMGMVTRDMTPEEEQAYLAEQANIPVPEPTPEERIAELESALSALLEGRVE